MTDLETAIGIVKIKLEEHYGLYRSAKCDKRIIREAAHEEAMQACQEIIEELKAIKKEDDA